MGDLDAVEIVMAIEEAFEITITDEEAEQIMTIGDLVRFFGIKTKKTN